MDKVQHSGGCHCGAVRFKVWAPKDLVVFDCNCSVCVKKQYKQFNVPDEDFELVKGAEYLSCYTFNTHQAKHTFCSKCGVQSFYTPRSIPNGKGISIHCLDPGTVGEITIVPFDGQNWEKAIQSNPSVRKDHSQTN